MVRVRARPRPKLILMATRPVILNGIEDIVTRPDLADRALFLMLEPIPEESRKPEAELWAAFETKRPCILGALLDAVVRGIQMLTFGRVEMRLRLNHVKCRLQGLRTRCALRRLEEAETNPVFVGWWRRRESKLSSGASPPQAPADARFDNWAYQYLAFRYQGQAHAAQVAARRSQTCEPGHLYIEPLRITEIEREAHDATLQDDGFSFKRPSARKPIVTLGCFMKARRAQAHTMDVSLSY